MGRGNVGACRGRELIVDLPRELLLLVLLLGQCEVWPLRARPCRSASSFVEEKSEDVGRTDGNQFGGTYVLPWNGTGLVSVDQNSSVRSVMG